ncbi:MFS transporter [Hazenella sp. IB182353]|uniref:MFS transporter n=1 Tax=Polycladospora coralii TaxID=2771432 RepID=UPI001745C85F|nr:MFS transporter [Polycladospora coralii]MBS7530276.1 MFS transporter [Polycladospora coralii]
MNRFKVDGYLFSFMLGTLDLAIFTPVIPNMMQSFSYPIHWFIWILAVQLVFFPLSLSLYETWVGLLSYQVVMTLSFCSFVVGSLTMALSSGWIELIGGRVLQAIGAGGIFPFLYEDMRMLVQRRKHKENRLLIGAVGACMVLTPIVATTVTHFLGWRMLFLLGISVASLYFIMAIRIHRKSEESSRIKRSATPVYLYGVIVAFLMFTISQVDFFLDGMGWFAPNVMPFWIMAVGLTVPVIMIERQAEHPFFEPHLIANWRLWLLYGYAGLSGLIWIGLILLPGFVVWQLQLSLQLQSLFFSMLLMVVLVTLPFVYKLSKSRSYRLITAFGFLLGGIAYALFAFATLSWQYVLLFLLLGCALSFTLLVPIHDVLRNITSSDQMQTSGLTLSLLRGGGAGIGLILFTQLLSSYGLHQWMQSRVPSYLFVQAQQHVLLLAAAVSFCGVLLSLLLPTEDTSVRSNLSN